MSLILELITDELCVRGWENIPVGEPNMAYFHRQRIYNGRARGTSADPGWGMLAFMIIAFVVLAIHPILGIAYIIYTAWNSIGSVRMYDNIEIEKQGSELHVYGRTLSSEEVEMINHFAARHGLDVEHKSSMTRHTPITGPLLPEFLKSG